MLRLELLGYRLVALAWALVVVGFIEVRPEGVQASVVPPMVSLCSLGCSQLFAGFIRGRWDAPYRGSMVHLVSQGSLGRI